MDIKERIATCLKWTVADVNSMSMQSLRELVRPVSQKLAAEITQVVQSGGVLAKPDESRERASSESEWNKVSAYDVGYDDAEWIEGPRRCLRDMRVRTCFKDIRGESWRVRRKEDHLVYVTRLSDGHQTFFAACAEGFVIAAPLRVTEA